MHTRTLILILVLLLASVTAAQDEQVNPIADEPDGCAFAEYVTGNPASLVMQCDFTGDNEPNSTITIVDVDADLVFDRDNWRSTIDMDSDIWLFDYQADGVVEILIHFREQGEDVIADIYQAGDTETSLRYNLSGMTVDVEPADRPIVQVMALGGWWQRDGLYNFNLDVTIDGDVEGVFEGHVLYELHDTDGEPDTVIKVRDTTGSGRPDHDWRTVFFPPADEVPVGTRVIQRTYLTVNTDDSQAPLVPRLPWPHIAHETYSYLTSSPHRTSEPPIQVRWDEGKIHVIGEYVTSRGNDDQWFAYTDAELQSGVRNQPNFEAPFAWYDMAADDDRRPELAVRTVYFPPHDPEYQGGEIPHPVHNVRYTWDQDNNGFWDYKLALLGRNPIESTVTLPAFDLELEMTSYEDLPGYVLDQEWTTATFVVSEENNRLGEGLYEWDFQAWTELFYNGRVNTPLPLDETGSYDLNNLRFNRAVDEGQEIEAGMRGEYHFVRSGPLTLYFSAIDRRLHLYQAEGGLWNIDNVAKITYDDSSGDGYMDRWFYHEDDVLMQQLYRTDEYIIYNNGDTVQVIAASTEPYVFKTLPPSSTETWQALDRQLNSALNVHRVDVFADMAAQFAEQPTWQINGATLEDFRLLDDGFRFVIELDPGFGWSSELANTRSLNVDAFTPGRYVLTWSDGDVTLAPFTPANLEIDTERVTQSVLELRALDQIEMYVPIRNTGLEDVIDGRLYVYNVRPNGDLDLQTEVSFDVYGGEETQVAFTWSPRYGGEYTLLLEAGMLDDVEIATTDETVLITDSSSTNTADEEAETEVILPTWTIVEDARLSLNITDVTPVSRGDFLGLFGNQPVNGVFVPMMLAAIAVTAMSLFALIVRKAL